MSKGKSPTVVLIGKYSVHTNQVIGRGAYGVVFLGYANDKDEKVAVKAIPLGRISKAHLYNLKNEIDLLKSLKNRHIVQYKDHEETRDHLYIMMEHMEGGSLASLLKRHGSFPEQVVAQYAAQVVDGLRYLHKEGVIHRDIKAANLLTKKVKHGDTEAVIVKLADFGVACTTFEDRSGEAAGSPYWMAPEVIQLHPASVASDIWSLGCTLIELLTGDPPNFDLMPVQALYRIVSDEPRIPTHVSLRCREFLLRCFKKDPTQRPSAKDLMKDRWLAPIYSHRKGSLEDESVDAGSFRAKKPLPNPLQQRPNPIDASEDDETATSRSQRIATGNAMLDLPGGASPHLPPQTASSANHRSRASPSASKAPRKGLVDEWLTDVELRVMDNGEPAPKEGERRGPRTSTGADVWPSYRDQSEEDSTDPDFPDAYDIDLHWDPRADDQRVSDEHRNSLKQKVEGCLALLSAGTEVQAVVDACRQLSELFKSHPKSKDHFIRRHGIFSIIELLEVDSADVVLSILQVVNQITCDNTAVLESLCCIGALPIIGNLARCQQPPAVRLEVCTFVLRLLKCSAHILDMFILSNGMKALVQLLSLPSGVAGMRAEQHIFDQCRMCLQTAVEAIHHLLNQKLRVAHNHLCVLLVVNHVGEPLSQATVLFLKDPKSPPTVVEMTLTVWTFLTSCTSSGQSADVRSRLSTATVVHRLFECVPLLQPKDKVQLLNCVLSLTQSSDLANISNAGCIVELINVLGYVAEHSDFNAMEMEDVVLASLYNLTKVHSSPVNWQQAANSGIVPHLKRLIGRGGHALTLAVPMMCEMVCGGGRDVRAQLWQHEAVDFLLGLLTQPGCDAFKVTIMNCMYAWLNVKDAEESKRLEATIADPKNLELIGAALRATQHTNDYASILEILAWFCNFESIADGFGTSEPFMDILKEGLHRGYPQSGVRLNLLKIVSRIFECTRTPKQLLIQHQELCGSIEALTADSAQLNREFARKLLNAFISVGKVGSLAS
eukprot:GGOE01005374.1.p1 GENE.GGOE01005374.1~~GGOE01005374.1.p1  ORF type:complete len:1020 (+),score=355.41 GGOE01005374.1:53-3061(+)